MGRSAKTKKNIPLRLAAALLCLTLVSTYLVSGLLARYTAQGNGDDAARVAGFCPTASISPDNGIIKYATDDPDVYVLTYKITVENPSEVAVDYDLVVSFASTDLYGSEISLDSTAQTIKGTPINYGKLGTLTANDTGATHKLKFTVTKAFVEEKIAATSDSKLDLSAFFTATVTFTQVD